MPLGNIGYDATDSYFRALGAAFTWKFGTYKLYSVSCKIKRCQRVNIASKSPKWSLTESMPYIISLKSYGVLPGNNIRFFMSCF